MPLEAATCARLRRRDVVVARGLRTGAITNAEHDHRSEDRDGDGGGDSGHRVKQVVDPRRDGRGLFRRSEPAHRDRSRIRA